MELLRIFLLSSLILVVFGFTNAQATPSDDLEITSLYKPPNNPPPRLNISYEIIAEWANNGNYDYNATVRLYSDCDQNNLTDESDTITMGAGESDTVTLEITFDETGEVCYSATIYYSSSNYGIFENYIDVEPETDEADLWVDPNSTLNGRNVISGEKVSFEVEYGNRGNVSTLNPVTITAYFGPDDEAPSNLSDIGNYMFYYISPLESEIPPDKIEWTYTIPSDAEKGIYVFLIIIDSDENNTEEDPSLSNNLAYMEVNVEPPRGVEIDVDVTTLERIPGANASFNVTVKNTGNVSDTILLSILDDDLGWASVYPESVELDANETVTVIVTVALPEYDDNCTSQERDALEGNQYEVRIKAKSESDLAVSENEELTTEIGDIYGASLTVIGEDVRTAYPSAEDNEEDRMVKFTLKLRNLGNRQDSILVETIETTYPDDWDDVSIFTSSSCSGSFTGLIAAGATRILYLCITPNEDADEGNYTIITEASAGDGQEEAVQASVTVDVRDPIRDLSLTPIDTIKEIYPEYMGGGSSSKNKVKFKVKLENTGSHKDTYIPDIESTLDDDWSVSFWQDSGQSQIWSSSGVDIEAEGIDDLWVFVVVDDEAEEGNHTIEISVRDTEDNPDARKEVSLRVVVQRPEIVVSQENIQLEIDGAIGNASQVKDGDTVVVLVNVQNIGNADADDVKIEIYYYPKKTPETTQEIDSLVIAGFIFDEGENTYIKMLYSKDQNIKSDNQKTIASDDWLIEGGEWYVEVRADYDEDDYNGAILEPNENNNDARYSELLRVKPDLSIVAMRVDSKYAGYNAQTPNINDTVTFTVTISNKGAADVSGARLYITADSSQDNEVLKDRTNQEYVEFDVDAGETTDVRFRWKATLEDWTTFRAEINPVCDDYEISFSECDTEGDGFSSETGHMFDELGRYADNEYPRSGVFEQSGSEVRFDLISQIIEGDGDKDGVLNDYDTCPNTPEGAIVDSIGCSSSEKDEDNDGITDALDACPGTIQGQSVDKFGCILSSKEDEESEDYEGDEAGECSDEADNDKDGLFDCDDDTCAGSPACKATDLVDSDSDETLPSLPFVLALILIGLLAILRRK